MDIAEDDGYNSPLIRYDFDVVVPVTIYSTLGYEDAVDQIEEHITDRHSLEWDVTLVSTSLPEV